VATALVLAPPASPSQTIDPAATGAKLFVNAKGEALITYTAKGKEKHVLAWGAVNASASARGAKQVAFSLDYAGGWGKYHTTYWKTFGTTCLPYDGPPLAWKVAACKAPDGSYWAIQSWQQSLPNYGGPVSGAGTGWELHLSHWTGALPVLNITVFRAREAWDRLFGSFTYGGGGVYGFKVTSRGSPLDDFGRNVYVDTFDSAYGTGWKRENSFLTHGPGGTFCYLFAPHGGRPSGNGKKYRATVIGPGVTPDLMWSGSVVVSRTAALLSQVNAGIAALRDPACKPA
jgi:hypothetical protein